MLECKHPCLSHPVKLHPVAFPLWKYVKIYFPVGFWLFLFTRRELKKYVLPRDDPVLFLLSFFIRIVYPVMLNWPPGIPGDILVNWRSTGCQKQGCNEGDHIVSHNCEKGCFTIIYFQVISIKIWNPYPFWNFIYFNLWGQSRDEEQHKPSALVNSEEIV